MKNLIVSPHTDDAIFSMGSFIAEMKNVTILSPFAGVPEDEAGKKKHTVLRQEHAKACEAVGAQFINGDFLDDVYPDRELFGLKTFLQFNSQGFDNIYIPLGIHHPDHILIREMFINQSGLRFNFFYQELPYATRYPQEAGELFDKLIYPNTYIKSSKPSVHSKEEAVAKYQSQIDEEVLRDVLVMERIYCINEK